MGSRFGLLRLGKMMARFQGEGKLPVEREPFTIFVRMGARMGRNDLTKDAGIGSRMQDLLGAEETRETISSSDNSLNWWKVCWNSMFELSEGVTEDDDALESMVERMLSTLRTKKLARSTPHKGLTQYFAAGQILIN